MSGDDCVCCARAGIKRRGRLISGGNIFFCKACEDDPAQKYSECKHGGSS